VKSFEGLTQFEIKEFKDENGKYYPAQTIQLDPTKTILEFREFTGVRPDVTVVSENGLTFAIEIFVTNKTKERKINRLKEHNLPTLEIGINDFYTANQEQCKVDVLFIEKHARILTAEMKRKKWLSLPLSHHTAGLNSSEKPILSSTNTPHGNGCCLSLIYLIPILLIIY